MVVKEITVKKVIIFIVIVGGFVALSYFISKAFASNCVKGQVYDNSSKKCVNECNGKFKDGKGGCRDCLNPDQFKPPGGECQYDCSKYSETSESCGTYCINTNTQECLNNKVCDKIRVTYDNECCPSGTIYRKRSSDIWPSIVPWKNTDNINTMNKHIKDTIKDNKKYKIDDKEYNDLENNLKRYNISTVEDFTNASDRIWARLKLSETFKNIIRPALGKFMCSDCEGELCGDTCCSTNEACIGNVCCLKERINGDKCCKVFAVKDGCCDDGDIIKDGMCHTKCTNNDLSCRSKDQVCENINIYDINGIITEQTSKCRTKDGCSFEEIDYSPNSIKNPDSPQNPFHVCSYPNNQLNGPFATCKLPKISSYEKTAKSKVSIGSTCTVDDCFYRMKDQGVMSIDYDIIKDGQNVCKSRISCKVAEGTNEPCDTATCPVGNRNPQCCWSDDDNTKYSGKICNEGSICKRNGNEHECVNGWESNGKTFPDMDCVLTTGKDGFPTQEACVINMCEEEGMKCCADGWTYRDGKCYQDDPPDPYHIMYYQTHIPQIKAYCNYDGDNGTCGPAWRAYCQGSGSAYNDISACYSYPASDGGPPNKVVPYCICNGGEWVNYDKGSEFHVLGGSRMEKSEKLCNRDTPDNC